MGSLSQFGYFMLHFGLFFFLEKPFLFPLGSRLEELSADEASVPINMTDIPIIFFQNQESELFVSVLTNQQGSK